MVCPGCTGPACFLQRPYDDRPAGHLRGRVAQLPDLIQTRGKAQNGLHTHPWPKLWPPTSNQRPKWDFHRAWSLSASLQGVEYVLTGVGGGFAPLALMVGEVHPSGFLITSLLGNGLRVHMHCPHDQGRPWNLLHVVAGPWTSFVAVLDKGQLNIAICRRHRGRDSALRGCKSVCKVRESACKGHKSACRDSKSDCIASESAIWGLEIVAEAWDCL